MAKRSKQQPKRQSRSEQADQGASLVRTYGIAFVLVNYILWGIAVAVYHGGSGLELEGGLAVRPRRSGILMVIMSIVVFITSSFTALPKIGSVISGIWTDHRWFVAVVGAVNALLFLFMVWLKKVEHDLNSGRAFGKRQSSRRD